MRNLIFTLALLSLIGCASSGGPGPAGYGMTLCIQNDAIGYGNLVARVGTTRFTVLPGDEECKDVNAVGGGIPVRAATTGGGAGRPLRFAFELPTTMTDCWFWRVSSSQMVEVEEC